MVLLYHGDIRVDSVFIALKCVENYIRRKRNQKVLSKIYIDGGTRGSRICLVDKEQDFTIVKTRGAGLTNNELEYLALEYALRYIENRYSKKDVIIYSDSKLVVNQINGDWRVTTETLRPLYLKCARRMNHRIKLKWVSRDFNLAGHVLEK